jgi:hypothetical protein
MLLEDPWIRPVALDHDVRDRDSCHRCQGGTQCVELRGSGTLGDEQTRNRVHVDRNGSSRDRLGRLLGVK